MSDDDTIDLGKLWRKLRKKEEAAQPSTPVQHSIPHTEHSSVKEETVTFTTISNFFKGLLKPEGHASDTAEFDVKKHLRWIIPTFLIIGLFLFAFHIRAQTVDLPALEDSAENNVHNFYRNQARDRINQQFPNLPEQNKDALVEQDFKKFLQENRELLQQQTESAAEQYKAHFRDPDGQTYLLGIDSYYYFR